MKVFITGASGFVGAHLVQLLLQQGHELRALVRTPSHSRLPAHPALSLVTGDILDAWALEQGMAGCDAVIHLVGIISEAGRQTFEAIHGTGTERMVQAATQSGIGTFLHMSSLGTRPNARSRYHQSKWHGEEAVRKSGLRWEIFRPSVIYGPGDLFVSRLDRMARWSPFLPYFGNGRSLLQPIAVEEVALAFARALGGPTREAFDLCGPERLPFRQVLETILEVRNRRRLLLSVPFPVARISAAILEFVFGTVLRRPPLLNRDQLLMLEEDNVGDPQPAASRFGLPLTPFNEGIQRMLGH